VPRGRWGPLGEHAGEVDGLFGKRLDATLDFGCVVVDCEGGVNRFIQFAAYSACTSRTRMARELNGTADSIGGSAPHSAATG
jgi:hypothetical protein